MRDPENSLLVARIDHSFANFDIGANCFNFDSSVSFCVHLRISLLRDTFTRSTKFEILPSSFICKSQISCVSYSLFNLPSLLSSNCSVFASSANPDSCDRIQNNKWSMDTYDISPAASTEYLSRARSGSLKLNHCPV